MIASIEWMRRKWNGRGGGPEGRYIVDLARRDVKRVKKADKERRREENRRGVV